MNPVLNHSIISPSEHTPESWLLVLHGAFGTGRNWGTVARRLVRAQPQWGAVLVDLRMHGASQGFTPPHSLEACAVDLHVLMRSLSLQATAVVGHSFGGKVALVFAGDHPEGLRQAWLIDSDPSAAEPAGSAWQMLQAARALPSEFASREEAMAGLERFGFERRVAEWMTTNLERRDGRYRWRLDFDAMGALLIDFFQTDCWSVVENPPPGVKLHFVKATDSDVLKDAAVERLETVGRATGRVAVHRIQGGHWLNADNPDAIVGLLASILP